MANQLYPHSSTYASSVPGGFLTSRSTSDPYPPDSPCFGSSRFLDASAPASDYNATAKLSVDSGLYSDRSYLSGHFDGGAGLETYGTGHAGVVASGLLSSGSRTAGHIDASVLSTATAVQAPKRTSWLGIGDGINVSGSKRALDVIYNQPVLCADNSIGQSEAWLSTSPLGKRHRFKSTSNLPMYPQRPGEKMCPHYKLTRTCKFGDNCKFAHPSWVLDGGIPDGKEVPRIPEISHESFPERPGAPDCHYFLKTQKCKFGLSCKFNHPKANQVTSGNVDASTLPQRLSEPSCSFYLKTGTCKFGQSCKFHHPKEIQLSSARQGGEKDGHNVIAKNYRTTGDVLGPKLLSRPLLLHNSKGLPLRLGELDCPFYMKTGSCKYGVSCRYNHPEQHVIIPPAAPGHSISSSPKIEQNVIVNPAASILQAFGSGLANVALGLHMPVYPQRPGQIECDYYMKTGGCKFGESCRFHHPIDQSVPTPKQAPQFSVKLTLAGLPRREGAVHCPFYMKTGICKYGANCKFDHPTPGDALAMSAKQGTYNTIEEEGKKEEVQLQESPTVK